MRVTTLGAFSPGGHLIASGEGGIERASRRRGQAVELRPYVRKQRRKGTH